MPKEKFESYLKSKKLQLTAQRSFIFDEFVKTSQHLSIEEIYQKVYQKNKKIGIATVYRVIKLLCEAGIAEEFTFEDGITRYENTFGKGHHDHLICEKCGKQEEVVSEEIEQLQQQLAAKHGFNLTKHKMYLYGICLQCREQ